MCQDRTTKLRWISELLAWSLPELNVRSLTREHGPWPTRGPCSLEV